MFNQEKSLEGNRAYRRKIKKLESTAPSRKLKAIADNHNDTTSKQRAAKVALRIDKVQARKLERLAVAETNSVGSTDKQSKKLSPAQQKQLKKRVKRIKFINKVKKIIG